MRVCDICDRPIDGDPIRFGWGSGGFYETDLCEEHKAEVTELMERLVKSARRLGVNKPVRRPVPDKPRPAKKGRTQVNTNKVRAWALSKGYEVSDRGRLPASLIDKYLASIR